MTGADYWRTRQITRRNLVAAGSAGLAAAGLASCGRTTRGTTSAPAAGPTQPASSGTPRPGGTLNIYVNLNAPLDPQKTSGVSAHQVIGGVYSRIFKFKTGLDPKVSLDKNVENDLGTSAETPDGMTWTIKLRPDARFTNTPPVNGHAVDAEDVKATFIRALDPATNNPNRGQIGMIDPAGIQTPDATTVVFKLRYPYAPFNRTVASPNYSLIIPREALAGSYNLSKVAIGSGPFTLVSAVPDVAYTYQKNAGYFDRTLPNMDGIRLAIIPDTSQQLAQFTAGNLDELTLDSPFSLDTATKSNPKASLVKAIDGQPSPVFWQMGDSTSVFQDVRVRRALNMAMDRDTIAKVIFNGEAEAPVFIPLSMGKWAMQIKDLPANIQQYYKYNPADAKKMLDAAGVTGMQFRLVYPNTFGTPSYVKHCETIGSMLNAVGVKANIEVIDYNKDYIDSGKGISQGYYPKDMLVFGGFSVYTEADEWIFSYLDSQSVNSHINVKDPTLDAMIDKERATLNEDDRVKSVLAIQSYVADNAYYLPTVGTYYLLLIQPRVQNYQFSAEAGKPSETYAKLWLSA